MAEPTQATNPSATNLQTIPIPVHELLGGLNAYAQTYGVPATPEALTGVVGALITARLHAMNLPVPSQVEAVIPQVIAGFDAGQLATVAIDGASQHLATAAHHWRTELMTRARAVFDAYVQQQAPALAADAVEETCLAVLAVMPNGPTTRAESQDILHQVVKTFSLEQTLAAIVPPELGAVASRVAIALQQKPLAQAVTETLTAYTQQLEAGLEAAGETISETLIENALAAILNNQVQFDWDLDLRLGDRQLLIQQVSFQINLMKASPPPSKTAQQIAADLRTEIARFQKERADTLGEVNVAIGITDPDDLSISSPWHLKPNKG